MQNNAQVFLQYKNTDICLDFWCKCGAEGHYDGYFANTLRCTVCNVVFELPHLFFLKPTIDDRYAVNVEMDEDDQG